MDKRRALKDGTYPIQIKVGYGTNLYLPTNIYLMADEWNSGLQICTGRNARTVNNILATLLRNITNRILELRETGRFEQYTSAQLRQMLTDLSLTAPTVCIPTLGAYFDKVRDLKSGTTRQAYCSAKKKLAEYCDVDNLRFTAMDHVWFEKFIGYMKGEGLKQNTRAMYVRVIKTVIRYAEEDGAATNRAYRKVNCRPETDTPMRNLPVETFRRIKDTPVKEKAGIYKDAFLLSFYLIGINMADLLALPKDCIVNGRLHYKRAKTGKNYSIKVWPEAQAIIDKYPGKTYLLSFGEKKRCFQKECNRYLSFLEPGLTWYWARYSWANYAVDLDIPKDTISEALGHKHGSNVTGIYIKYSTDKVDVANRQVIDHMLGIRR